MNLRHRVVVPASATAVVLLAQLVLAPSAWAIPAFARKYKTGCQTCHSIFPKLNSFGKAFRAKGYKYPEPMESQDDIEMKETGTKGLLPAIPGVAIRALMAYNASPDNDFLYPLNVSLLAGGTLGKEFSFFGEELIDSAGSGAVLLRAFVQYNQIGNTPWFNVRLGQFEIAANPFSTHRQFMYTDPFFTGTGVQGLAGLSGNQRGLEFFGFSPSEHGGFSWAAGVINGNGAPGLGQGRGGFTFDDNKKKDFYGSLSYKVGGAGVAKFGDTPDKWWRDDSITFGIMGYKGKAPLDTVDDGLDTMRTAAYVDWYFKDLELFGGYTKAKADLNYGSGSFAENNAWFIEADYFFNKWLVGGLRYDVLHDEIGDTDVKRITPALAFSIKPNLKAHVEAELYDNDSNVDDRYTFYVDFAF